MSSAVIDMLMSRDFCRTSKWYRVVLFLELTISQYESQAPITLNTYIGVTVRRMK